MVDEAAMNALKKQNFWIDKAVIQSEIDDRLKAVDALATTKLSNVDKQIEEAVERKVKEYFTVYSFNKAVEHFRSERDNEDA